MHVDARVTRQGETVAAVFLHKDHLVSNRAETDAAGKILSRVDYGPYGEILAAPANDNVTPIPAVLGGSKGYINERFDAETGLQYLNARYMDPPWAASSAQIPGTR